MRDDLRGFGRLVRHNPDFRRLWISHMISLVGDWLSYIAVSVIVVEEGAGALAVGMVLVVHSLPVAMMSPISGPLADRLDRKRLLIGGYLGAALLTLGMWAVADAASVWWLQALLFLRVCVSCIAMTARSAAIPALVEREDLRLANALLGLTWSLMFTLGLALGGFASEILSPKGAIFLDAWTFVAAAWVAFTLPSLRPEVGDEGPPRPGFADMLRAWRFVSDKPRLMATVLAKTPPCLANAGAWVTLNLVAGERLSAMSTALALGVMQSVRAIGTGIGPLLPARLLPRNPLVGTAVAFVGFALFVGFDWVWLSVVALGLWGIGQGHNWVVSTAELQASIPDHLLGRIIAIDLSLLSFGGALSAVLAGLICDAVGDATSGAWLAIALGVSLWLYCVVLSSREGAQTPE